MNIKGNGNVRGRVKKHHLVLIAAILIFPCAAAENQPSVMSSGIYRTVWRWNPGETAEFEGNIICDHVDENHPLIISLSAEAVSDDTEVTSPVFRYVNGTKQSNRHPKSEITVTESNQSIRFTGGWKLPENVRIDEAVIHLKIYSQNEELLSESELRMKNDQVVAGATGYHFPELGKPVRYIIIAAAVIWILAVIRMIINRQRR